MVLLLPIGFRRTGLCIFPGAVLGRDEPGCGPHKTHTVSTHTNTNTLSALSVHITFIQHNKVVRLIFHLRLDVHFVTNSATVSLQTLFLACKVIYIIY